MKLLYLGLIALCWWSVAAILGLAVNLDDRLTLVLAGAWTLSMMLAILLVWWRERHLRGAK